MLPKTEWTPVTILKIGAAVLAGAVLVALFPPASWLAQRVRAASTGRVRLENAQGTVWMGHATLRIKERGVKPIYIQNVNWQMSPLELLRDKRTLELNFALYSGWGTVVVGKSDFKVSNLEFEMDPGELAKFVRGSSLAYSGKAHIRLEQMHLQRKDDDLVWDVFKAKMNWNDAAMTSPFADPAQTLTARPMLQLGDVSATLSAVLPQNSNSSNASNSPFVFTLDAKGGDVGVRVVFKGDTPDTRLENAIEVKLEAHSPPEIRTVLEQNENFTSTDGQTFTLKKL